jgi:hypothetical protein
LQMLFFNHLLSFTKKCPLKHDSFYHIVCTQKFKLEKISSCQQVIAICANLRILGREPITIGVGRIGGHS